MSDQINGVGIDEQTIPEELPTSNVEEEAEARPAEATTEAEQTTDESSDSAEESLPADHKQREAFIKMRQRIKELEAKQTDQDDLDLVNLARGVPTGFETPVQTPNNQFDETDPVTKAFLDRVKQAELTAKAAEAKASAKLEDFEAWQKYPFLRPTAPKTEEQKLFLEQVREKYMADSLKARSLGKQAPSLVDVADRINARFESFKKTTMEVGANEARKLDSQKEAAVLESAGTRTNLVPAASSDRVEELRRKANRGDNSALAELLKLEDPYIQGIE